MNDESAKESGDNMQEMLHTYSSHFAAASHDDSAETKGGRAKGIYSSIMAEDGNYTYWSD